ncbi:MAG: ABC transporter substrate-binding protein [Phycisphaerales bacterium]|nr:ABC transporter substrate-binding protein [Phycisphaerales bacterium]
MAGSGDRPVLTLGHSPDADDMVMWWPLVGMRDPEGLPVDGPEGTPVIVSDRFSFQTIPDDVQRLNRRAIERGDLDITAISAHAYPYLKDRYRITRSGASMGEGYGPKLVVQRDNPAQTSEALFDSRTPVVAVPGVHTTAYLTLRLLLGRDFEVREMLFSEIPGAVAEGEVDAGLLIHEAQIAFEQLGLRRLMDLGEAWSIAHKLPLPLGLNVLKRDLDDRYGSGSVDEVAQLLGRSVRHAREHAEASKRFLLLHADARPEWRDEALVDRYLAMYVSGLTLDMGEPGRKALELLLGEGFRAGLSPDPGHIDLAG